MENIVRIKGKNINLCVGRQDEEAIAKYMVWINDEEIIQWLGRNNKTCYWEEEREFAKCLGTDKNTHFFNIVRKDTNEMIGNCDIKVEGSNGLLGIMIGEQSGRDKGFGTETIKMLIKYCFEELNLHRVYLHVKEENERAHACYKKAGLKDCGIAHESTWWLNHWCNVITMEILRSDYEGK